MINGTKFGVNQNYRHPAIRLNTSAMLHLDHLSVDSRLRDLPSHECRVSAETPGSTVAAMFETQQDIPGVILCGEDGFVGVLSRRRYLENVGQPFGVDVYMNRPINLMLDHVFDEPLILPDDYPIGEASQLALNRSHESVYEPVVIQTAGGELLLLDAYVLLFAQSQLLTLMNSYIQKQKEASDILRAASTDLSSSLNLQEIFEKVMFHMQKLLHFDHACIYIIEKDFLSVKAQAGINQELDLLPYEVSLTNSLVSEVINSNTVIIRHDVRLDTMFQNGRRNNDTRDWMAVPLITGGKVIGLITLDSKENNLFTEEVSQQLQLFANQASSPIQNALLYFGEKKRAHQMEALNNVTSSLVSTLDLQPLLEKILLSATGAIPVVSRGVLYIHDTEKPMPHIGAVYGIDSEYIGECLDEDDWQCIAGELEERKPCILNGKCFSNGKCITEIIPGYGKCESTIVVPLMHENRFLGLLMLGSEKLCAFTHDEVQVMQVFATTATAAICNAQLHSEVEQLAVTDTLTTLYNRRGFYNMAHVEVARSLKNHCALSLLIIDIDLFKKVNDRYGHDIGDQVLRSVAFQCKQVVRSSDLVCRYGGEEFVVLLPETSEPQAFDVAERLRQIIAESAIQTAQGSITVTVSMGVAELNFELDEMDHAFETLINRADQALYVSKKSGRNQVTLWSQDIVQTGLSEMAASSEVDQLTETLYQREEELRQLEATSQATQEHLSSILQNASEAIISVNRTNMIVMCNKSAEQMFGYSSSDLLGIKLNVLLPEQFDLTRYLHYSGKKIDTQSLMLPRRQQLTGRKIDGFEFPVEASYSSFGVNEDIFFTVILTDITDHIEAEQKIRQYNLELSRAYDKTIEGWAHALELRDLETHGHSNRVVDLTLKIARFIGIREEDLIHIRRGALLHDIGKIAIPDSIMLKAGPLSEEDWKIMYTHPIIADELLSPIDFLIPAMDIPRYHHEKWDGSGYPYRLSGTQIPLAARIFAVVDVWDALVNVRPYKHAWKTDEALKFIQEASGTHFDPLVVKAFLQVLPEDILVK